MGNKVLITGAAGFIGFHLSKTLCIDGWDVTGIDNLNDYYDVNLKRSRLKILESYQNFKFYLLDLKDRETLFSLFKDHEFQYVVNLAAQAGVRYSLINPYAYIDSNISGFLNLLESCRNFPVKHLVYASSSSVYGNSTKIPFSTKDEVDHPVSLYAATKRANELMAHTYSHLFKIPVTGLRFFTVYGPWGRPDMAYFSFTKSIFEGKPISVYNYGKMKRDFTYIDDIIKSIELLIEKPPLEKSAAKPPYNLFNIGNNDPENLMKFISILEECIGKKAEKILLPMQPGDVPETYAETEDLYDYTGFKPYTPLETGMRNFVEWYKKYYPSSYVPINESQDNFSEYSQA